MYSYPQAMFCKFPKQHNYIYYKVLKNVRLMVHISVLELNFLRKKPLRSLCVTLDGGLTSKVCTALKGSLYSLGEKSVLA